MDDTKHPSSLSFKTQFSKFTDDTTLHGIKYPFDNKSFFIRRSIWCVIILGMVASLIVSLVNSTLNYYQSSTISSQILSANYSMPSITICPSYIMNNASVYESYPENGNDIIQYVQHLLIGSLNVSELPERVVEFINSEKLKPFYVNVASKHSYIQCKIKETYVNCKDYLQDVITDKGSCMTFQSQDFIDKYGAIMVEIAGPNNGISLTLDTEPDEEIYPLTYGTGFRVLIHDPKVYPLMEERSFVVGPGTETFVALDKSVSNYLRVPYSKGDCVNGKNEHSYEGKSLNNFYSSEGCRVKCTYDILYSNCKCNFFSSGKDACTLYDYATCALYNYDTIPQSDFIEKCSYCIPTCEQINFNSHVTSMGFPNKLAVEFAKFNNLTVQTKEEMRRRVLELKVFYKDMRYTLHEQIPSTDMWKMFSSFGGLMGLFMGASIITMLEFVDFFIMFVFKKCLQNRGASEQSNHTMLVITKEQNKGEYGEMGENYKVKDSDNNAEK